jgi:hypothetical protein
MVSHSQDFLNGVCTNIIQMQKKKLIYYTGTTQTQPGSGTWLRCPCLPPVLCAPSRRLAAQPCAPGLVTLHRQLRPVRADARGAGGEPDEAVGPEAACRAQQLQVCNVACILRACPWPRDPSYKWEQEQISNMKEVRGARACDMLVLRCCVGWELAYHWIRACRVRGGPVPCSQWEGCSWAGSGVSVVPRVCAGPPRLRRSRRLHHGHPFPTRST